MNLREEDLIAVAKCGPDWIKLWREHREDAREIIARKFNRLGSITAVADEMELSLSVLRSWRRNDKELLRLTPSEPGRRPPREHRDRNRPSNSSRAAKR